MKRFQVLCGNNEICIAEMPRVFKLKADWPEDTELSLVREVKRYFNCEAQPVYVMGIMEYVQTSLPDDYELCHHCTQDHEYDGPGTACVNQTLKG